MKSSVTAAAGLVAVFLAVLCGGSTAALSFNGNDRTVIDTLAWTNDLSQVNVIYNLHAFMSSTTCIVE